MFDLGDGLAVDASVMGNQTRRINHSAANPNVRALIVNERGVRRVAMYTRRAVATVGPCLRSYSQILCRR